LPFTARGCRALVCRKQSRIIVSAYAVFALWLAFLAFRKQRGLAPSPFVTAASPVMQRRVLTADGLLDVVGQPLLRISRNCSSNRWYDLELDGQCYRSQEANVLAVTGGDYLSTAVRCWGYAPPLEYPLHPLPNSALYRVDVYATREPSQSHVALCAWDRVRLLQAQRLGHLPAVLATRSPMAAASSSTS
jgi:hypothetical protein